jgi:hypothetical protein
LVDVATGRHALLAAVLPPGGTWSAVRTVRTFEQPLDIWSATMSRDGQVVVLLGGRRGFSDVHVQSRLYLATFDATP